MPENAKSDEANVLVIGNDVMKYSSLSNGPRPLPLELNCEIFKCLTVPIQTKFIWGLGRGIYAAFRHKLLVKTKRLRNPRGNMWIRTERTKSISSDGLTINNEWKIFFPNWHSTLRAIVERMMITPEQFFIILKLREFHHPTRPGLKNGGNSQFFCRFSKFWVDLSNGDFSADGRWICNDRNYYHFGNGYDYCGISGKEHIFKWPNGTIKPEWNGKDDVVGCGLVLSPANQLAIFFTGNGILMGGKQIEINPLADCIYPMVIMDGYANMSLHTNFGDDRAKPFKYDIEKCPGLGLD